jgi:protease I
MGSLLGKHIVIVTAHEFEDVEVLYPLLRFSEEGAAITIVHPPKDMPGHFSPRSYTPDKPITGRFGSTIPFVVLEEGKRWRLSSFDELDLDAVDAVFLPGGFGPDAVRLHEPSRRLVADAHRAGKVVAAICHGPLVLISTDMHEGTDLVRDREVTAYAACQDDLRNAGGRFVDAAAVVSGNVVTGRVPDDLPEFCRAVIGRLAAEVGDGVYELASTP